MERSLEETRGQAELRAKQEVRMDRLPKLITAVFSGVLSFWIKTSLFPLESGVPLQR